MTTLGLYKDNKLVDYGVINQWEMYEYAGYEVRILKGNRPALYRHAKAEFDALWNTLSLYQQRKLADVPRDDEMDIYEKLTFLKVEIATAKRRKIQVYPRRQKMSFWTTLKNEVRNLFTIQPEVAYA